MPRRGSRRRGCSPTAQWIDTTWDDALAIYCGVAKKVLDTDGPLRARVQLLRPRRRGRRIREHLGHRQADVHGAADADGAHPQPARLQLRVPRDARHGRRRAQQFLRGRGSSPTASWASARTSTRRRPTTSSRTGFRTCRAELRTNARSGSPTSRCRRRGSSSSIPRRTDTIAVAEQVAKDRVLHLDIEPGTDIALFNGLFHLRRRARAGSTRTSSPSTPTASTPPWLPTSSRSTSAAASPACRWRSSSRPPNGRTSRRRPACRRGRCTPTRRASSGATTTI